MLGQGKLSSDRELGWVWKWWKMLHLINAVLHPGITHFTAICRWRQGQGQVTGRRATLAGTLFWVTKQSKLNRFRKSSLLPPQLSKNNLDRGPPPRGELSPQTTTLWYEPGMVNREKPARNPVFAPWFLSGPTSISLPNIYSFSSPCELYFLPLKSRTPTLFSFVQDDTYTAFCLTVWNFMSVRIPLYVCY